jgi:hypothetical protein
MILGIKLDFESGEATVRLTAEGKRIKELNPLMYADFMKDIAYQVCDLYDEARLTMFDKITERMA